MIGVAVSTGFKMRVIQLEKLISMINEMEILIRFRAMRTKELIDEISRQDSFKNFLFLNNFNYYMSNEDINIIDCWKIAAEKTMFFEEKDKLILQSIGEQIGGTDVDGQLSMLSLNRNIAERNLTEAENNLEIKGKMLRTVWPLMGIIAGLLFI